MAQPNSELATRTRDDIPIVFKNGSAEIAPAFAIMQVDTVEGVPIDQARLVTIKKPDSTDGVYIINGPLAVRAGKQGRAKMASPMTIKCSGSPTTGATVGPSASSWVVSTSGSGYKVLGGAESGVVLCRDATGGGSGKTAIVRATAEIAAAAAGDPRVPETSTDFDTIQGDTFTEIENWSLVAITEDSYMVIVEIGGSGVIVSAFC